MARILVTGASGFLGHHVALHLRDRHEVFGLYLAHPVALEGCSLARLDLTDEGSVHGFLEEVRPDVIVHTAALGDADRCERHPAEAYLVNVRGTENLVQGAVRIGARLVYISTDLIYDGTKGDYDEEDEPRPLNVYAETKLLGEQRAVALCKQTLVLRLALMYGRGSMARSSFTDWLFDRLAKGQEVPLFADQYRTPLFVGQAAEVIGRLIEKPEVSGIYNLGGGERVSRYEFGLKFCEVFNLPKGLLKPIAMEAFGYAARRPKDCSLNSSKLSTLLNIRPLTVEEGLEEMLRGQGRI